MKQILLVCVVFTTFFSCKVDKEIGKKKIVFSNVNITKLKNTDSLNIRALKILNDTLIGFGYHKGHGFFNTKTGKLSIQESAFEEISKNENNVIAENRAVAFNGKDFFSLTIGSPAILKKIDVSKNEAKVVYHENHPNAFYDAMAFWNEKEGIALGDSTNDCMSILLTKDGGNTWQKSSCANLPKYIAGEAAFAASNTNIAIVNDKVWIATGGVVSRIWYSENKGQRWSVYETPIIQGLETTGMYSLDFYDKLNGFAIGGDYTKSMNNKANKIRTKDGGKTWQLVAENSYPGYRSCVQYIPNSQAKGLVEVGFKGVSYSNNSGDSWKQLSNESFFTIQFKSDSVAYAAGRGGISKLVFK